MGKEVENGELEKMLDRSSVASNQEMPLLALNHVSYVCKSLPTSVKFYEDVLGFVLVKRPSSFDFEGAWLFNHGIGIHLLEVKDVVTKKGKKINPKDNHISFQCSNMDLIIRQLVGMNIEYATAVVTEGGVVVDQLFFHDPDGYMIEICNCQNLPILPISSCPINPKSTTPTTKNTLPPISSCPINPKSTTPTTKNTLPSPCGEMCTEGKMRREVEALMLENLVVGMMDLYF